jgi:hypothetical protein
VADAGGGGGPGGDGGSIPTVGGPAPALSCPAQTSGTPGVWENVTPSGINLTASAFSMGNFGVSFVRADPVRPCELYAFTNYQGVWRSSDYGTTWTKLTATGTMDGGRAWGAALDPNPKRDPGTWPALYACQGYGPLGLYKSTNGGVSWKQLFGNTNVTTPINQFSSLPDLYSVEIDPNDSQHLLATFHGSWKSSDAGLVESLDGGATWRLHSPPANFGSSQYVFFISSTTWVTIAQWNNNTQGVWRTTTAGLTSGSPNASAWTQVAKFEHAHGSSQFFNAGRGVIYGPGNGGVYRSADEGATWTNVVSDGFQNAVYGTTKYIYADYGFATQGTQSQAGALWRSPITPGTSWTNYYPTPPSGMTNGADHAAVTTDGTHNIIVAGDWLAGIWRYVEP